MLLIPTFFLRPSISSKRFLLLRLSEFIYLFIQEFAYSIRIIPVVKLSPKHYATLNRWVMGIIFFIPLVLIASFESIFDRRKHTWMKNWFRGNDEGVEDTPEYRDPVADDPQCAGLEISKVPFSDLIKVFPNTSVVCFNICRSSMV